MRTFSHLANHDMCMVRYEPIMLQNIYPIILSRISQIISQIPIFLILFSKVIYNFLQFGAHVHTRKTNLVRWS